MYTQKLFSIKRIRIGYVSNEFVQETIGYRLDLTVLYSIRIMNRNICLRVKMYRYFFARDLCAIFALNRSIEPYYYVWYGMVWCVFYRNFYVRLIGRV